MQMHNTVLRGNGSHNMNASGIAQNFLPLRSAHSIHIRRLEDKRLSKLPKNGKNLNLNWPVLSKLLKSKRKISAIIRLYFTPTARFKIKKCKLKSSFRTYL